MLRSSSLSVGICQSKMITATPSECPLHCLTIKLTIRQYHPDNTRATHKIPSVSPLSPLSSTLPDDVLTKILFFRFFAWCSQAEAVYPGPDILYLGNLRIKILRSSPWLVSRLMTPSLSSPRSLINIHIRLTSGSMHWKREGDISIHLIEFDIRFSKDIFFIHFNQIPCNAEVKDESWQNYLITHLFKKWLL